MTVDRKEFEEAFHDRWAISVDPSSIDVIHANETCTAPEIRWVIEQLQPLPGKSILDLGCGLGESAVYFALRGAEVVALDLSPKMLNSAQRLARRYGVEIQTYKADVEDLSSIGNRMFDVIYVANLFHHVDIKSTLVQLVRHLKPDGALVSWDPLAYNPIINVYRRIARRVRTPEEHPFTMNDLRIFDAQFGYVETKFFWLTTLVIFVIMAVVQFQNPNRVRFWKKIIDDGDRWYWLYSPLERLDRLLLRWFPFLRILCWNVCILAKNPISNDRTPSPSS